jgi:hypothetical protein
LIALKFSQKVFNFRKIYTPKFLGCYRYEVGEGDDTVVVEDSSEEDDDEETLQERFQLRSRFSRSGLLHIPLVQDPPTSLEASLPAPPKKPRNMARKRVAKNLKVTAQVVSRLH